MLDVLAGFVEFVFELVFDLLFGWIPERPRWLRWVVILVYAGLVALVVVLLVKHA